MGLGVDKFLKNWYHDRGWSRHEAASKGNVSEGYLCHIFAGDVQFPRPKLFRDLVEGWGFDPVEFFMAGGYITREEDDAHVQRRIALGKYESATPEIKSLLNSILDQPKPRQQVIVAVCRAITFMDTRQLVAMEALTEQGVFAPKRDRGET